MPKQTLEEIVKEIEKDPLISEANKNLSEEEKRKVDNVVKNFIQNFVLPLQDLVQQAEENPEIRSNIRSILEQKHEPKKE